MEKSNVREYECEWCKIVVRQFSRRRSLKPKKTRRFCSKSCSNKSRHASGNLNSQGINNPMYGKSVYTVWIEKYGEEEAKKIQQEMLQKQITNNSGDKNGMFGKNHSSAAREKMSKTRLGVSFKSLWGVEKAERHRQLLSESMKGAGNPMYGKTSRGGRSVKGTYKGMFFRSLLEFSFMKYLESIGLDLKTDVEYESIRIPLGENRTYCVDFYVPSLNRVYEIKPFRVAQSNDNRYKFSVALEHLAKMGLEFVVATENDFKKLSFDEAKHDKDIVFDERTFSYFKKKINDPN